MNSFVPRASGALYLPLGTGEKTAGGDSARRALVHCPALLGSENTNLRRSCSCPALFPSVPQTLARAGCLPRALTGLCFHRHGRAELRGRCIPGSHLGCPAQRRGCRLVRRFLSAGGAAGAPLEGSGVSSRVLGLLPGAPATEGSSCELEMGALPNTPPLGSHPSRGTPRPAVGAVNHPFLSFSCCFHRCFPGNASFHSVRGWAGRRGPGFWAPWVLAPLCPARPVSSPRREGARASGRLPSGRQMQFPRGNVPIILHPVPTRGGFLTPAACPAVLLSSNTVSTEITSDPTAEGSVPQGCPPPHPLTPVTCLQYYQCFRPTSCRSEVPAATSSGSTGLLEQLTERREPIYSLDF